MKPRASRRSRWLVGALCLVAAGLSALPAAAQTAAQPVAATAVKVGAGGTAQTARPLAPAATQNRIVIQLNENDGKQWMAVLGNIRNIQAELGANNVRVAVVVIGYALGMLAADAVSANDVQDAMTTGVEFIACGNSMKAQKVAREDLVDGVTVATSGYVEIMRRQQQGWQYLRP